MSMITSSPRIRRIITKVATVVVVVVVVFNSRGGVQWATPMTDNF